MKKKSVHKLGRLRKTERDFLLREFKDRYDHLCTLQESSTCDGSVWLGPIDAAPKALASRASSFGVQTKETTGWVPFPIPDNVLLTTRMYLGRKEIKGLIYHLQKWLKKGSLE